MPPHAPETASLDYADEGRIIRSLLGDVCGEVDRLYDFRPGNVPKAAIINGLGRITETCALLDVLRGTMFRHKAFGPDAGDHPLLIEAIRRLGVPKLTHVNVFPDDLPQDARDMLNGILGIVAAAGAMADLMVKAFRSGTLDNAELSEQCQSTLYALGPIFRALRTSYSFELTSMHDRILATEFGDMDEPLAIASGSTVPPVPDNNA